MSRNQIGISRRARQWHHVLSAITQIASLSKPVAGEEEEKRGEETERERERERERKRRGEINFISGEYFHGYLFRESARPGMGLRGEGGGGGTRRIVDGDRRRWDMGCYRHPGTHPVAEGGDRRARFLGRRRASVLINRGGGRGGRGGGEEIGIRDFVITTD